MSQEQHTLKLLALVEAGEATEAQSAELLALLGEDAALLELARKQNAVHALLSVELEDEWTTETRLQSVADAVAAADSNQFVDAVGRRLGRRRWRQRAMAAAALVVIGLLSGIYLIQQGAVPSTMATLQQADGVQWSSDVLDHGSTLAAGASLEIDQGMLELDLAGRGRLIVEGPARLDFPAAGRAVLHQGRVVMRATEKGHGYQIETPQGNIIDIGTEFGVTVDDDGLVETHVIEGRIEAIPTRGQAVLLLGNDALKMGPEGGEPIAADAGEYYTLMPPPHGRNPKFIHWGFDEAAGEVAHSQGELAAKIGAHAEMRFYAVAPSPGPTWVAGPKSESGSALSFDGQGSYAESAYRGIGGGQPRTVCFWLKVPEDFSVKQGFGIVAWGRHARPGEVWQLSVNPLEQDGPIGRLRLGLIGGQVIGSSDLRDGRWHHIAVVMYGGSQPNVGTHVILYVDGERERVSRRALQEVRTEIDEAEHGVWVGRNSSAKPGKRNVVNGGFFRGELDELYIFDAALSQGELRQLMNTD